MLRGNAVYCPICERGYRRFLPCGVTQRRLARCPGCASLERHRLFWLTLRRLQGEGLYSFGGRLLHVAPEACLIDKLCQGHDYLSIDLNSRHAMRAMDITDLEFPDESFDVIICHHVLEHVPDDRSALSEFFRVLRPGGWASLQVPMIGAATDEDRSVTDPAERTARYGQWDHVRQYGMDFVERLQSVGFRTVTYKKEAMFSNQLLVQSAVVDANDVILATKALPQE